MRIQDRCRQIIRESNPRLSTGAYGDEGKILRDLEDLIESLMRGGQSIHIACGLAWRRNSKLDEIDMLVRLPIACATRAMAAHTKPRRLAMTDEEIGASKAELFNLLRDSKALRKTEFREIFEKYSRVMNERKSVKLVRGGEEWLLLQGHDLLCCLGPWIIEVEKIRRALRHGTA